MLAPEKLEHNILLGIIGKDSQNRYDLCIVNAVRVERQQAVVYEEGFESGNLWEASPGIKTSADKTLIHNGNYSLLINGNQQGSWNYASHNLEQSILPGSKYKLSCWLLVESIDPKIEPYLKIGLADSQDKWIENHNTNYYDLSKLGTWQYLETILETTVETVGGHLAVEKGSLETRITATIRIDDVKLELLELP